MREIIVRGSSGGPLAALANQVNHELTCLQEDMRMVASFAVTLTPVRHWPPQSAYRIRRSLQWRRQG